MPTTRGPSMAAGATMSGCIGATAGADICITATTRGLGTIRDFMDGATIPGDRRLPVVSGHGVGEERHGGDTMAGGGILIPRMQPHTTDRKSTRLNSSPLGISYAVF